MSVEEHKTPVANGDPDPITPLEEQGCSASADFPEPAADPAPGAVAPEAEEAEKPPAPPEKRKLIGSGKRQRVHVPANLQDLLSGVPITPEDVEVVRRGHLLNEVIQRLLTLGMVVSTVAMLAGLALDAISQHEVSHEVPQFREALDRALSLRGSGFLALGLLVLIATPIMRVLGSFFTFVYERDWRYAGITFAVLVILSLSMRFGRG